MKRHTKHSYKVVLHLGSNQGDRHQYLDRAVQGIQLLAMGRVHTSGRYVTEAWGVPDQSDFVNQAVLMHTAKTPFDLLSATQAIEDDIGRDKSLHWGPRNIDIDILYVDDVIINTTRLVLPHPRYHIRNFVLYPLVEVDGGGIHPIFGATNIQLLDRCPDQSTVKRIEASEYQ